VALLLTNRKETFIAIVTNMIRLVFTDGDTGRNGLLIRPEVMTNAL